MSSSGLRLWMQVIFRKTIDFRNTKPLLMLQLAKIYTLMV